MITIALNHIKQSSPEEPSVDPLADNDVGELEVCLVNAGGLEAFLDCLDLVLQHIVDQTINNSVPAQHKLIC